MELHVKRPENKGVLPDIQENILLRSKEKGHEEQADITLWGLYKTW